MGRVEYHLELPEEVSHTHNTFHISQLQISLANDSIVVLLEDIQVDGCRNYIERPFVIFNGKTKALRNKVVNLVKLQCWHRKGS